METLSAIRIHQGPPNGQSEGIDLFITAMTLDQLQKFTSVDAWSPQNNDGYQRPGNERRFKDVAKFVLEGKGILPTSILLGVRPDDTPSIELDGFGSTSGPVDMGTLRIPDGATLWKIDGQHRYGGVLNAFDQGGNTELADYPFPVVIMWHIDRFEEMEHFNIINTEQKKMSTEIVDRHLVAMQERHGVDLLRNRPGGERAYIRALTTKVVDDVNKSGVWQDQIAIPGVAGADRGLIRHHAMVVSLEPFMNDSWVKSVEHDDKVEIISRYWAAIERCCPEAFATPQDYRVQATAGIYSLHRALPTVVQCCESRGGLKLEDFQAVLEDTLEDVFTSGFWSKDPSVGHPLTVGTSMGSIRALAQFIIDALPKQSRIKL